MHEPEGYIGLSKVDIASKSLRRTFGSPVSAFKFEYMTSEPVVVGKNIWLQNLVEIKSE